MTESDATLLAKATAHVLLDGRSAGPSEQRNLAGRYLALADPVPVPAGTRASCLRCKHWWHRRDLCTAAVTSPQPGRPWNYPSTRPPWCPGFEAETKCHNCGRDLSVPVTDAVTDGQECRHCLVLIDLDAAAAVDAYDLRGTLDQAHVALGVVIAQENTGHDDGTYRVVRAAFDRVTAALASEESNRLEWLRRNRLDGDPSWSSAVGDLSLSVNVPTGCPWALEWCVEDEHGVELARGDLMLDAEDDAWEGAPWDYQGVEVAQQRCEAVARVLLGEVTLSSRLATTEEGDGG